MGVEHGSILVALVPQVPGRAAPDPCRGLWRSLRARPSARARAARQRPGYLRDLVEATSRPGPPRRGDNDGWLDILVLTGTRWDGAPPVTTNRLYKNNRNGTFTDVTVPAGLTRLGWFCGATIGDYNNDGFEDIFITGWPQNILYRNNGDGTFTDVTRQASLIHEAIGGEPAAPSSISTATATSISSSPTI